MGDRYDLVVIGSGPAGQRAAIAASKLDKTVAIVERNAAVGGQCVFRGTIPSKTLREVVFYLSGVREREIYGPGYRVKDRITIDDLRTRTQRVIENEAGIVRDQLVRNGVDVVPGTAAFADPHLLAVTGPQGARTLTADRVIVAVGTTPLRPPGIEFDERRIVDSDGLLDLAEISRTLTIVGAGVVGVEYATILRTLGVRVTVIDGRPRPLEFLDPEIEDALYYHMRDEGIVLYFGERVSRVAPTQDGHVLVTLESGKTSTTDAVMFSAGRVGATRELRLDVAGVETDAKGRITVDAAYRTNVPHIYAAGDIIGFPSLASTAMVQGRVAALHAFGMDVPAMPARLPYGLYTIPEVAMIGPTEPELTRDRVPYEVGIARFKELSRVQISGGHNGRLKLLFNKETRQLLAVHIIGQNATELVHVGQALIDHGASVTYLRDAVFNYPTFAEAYKIAALNGLNKL